MKIPVIEESRHCDYAQVSVPIGSQRWFRAPFLGNFRVADDAPSSALAGARIPGKCRSWAGVQEGTWSSTHQS